MQGAHLATSLSDPNARLLALAAGVILLVLGRRLFWLFVGIVGFFTVYQLSLESLHIHPPGVRLFLALLAGLFGVLLAIFVQRVAVGIAGFLVGAWLAAGFLGINVADVADVGLQAHGVHAASVSPGAHPWMLAVVLVAGILSAVLARRGRPDRRHRSPRGALAAAFPRRPDRRRDRHPGRLDGAAGASPAPFLSFAEVGA